MADAIEMQIFENEGMVVIGFPKMLDEISMPPEVARGVAEEIAKKAFQGEFKGKPINSNMLVEQKRATMINRAKLILNNLDSKGVKRETIAAQIVDSVMAEVL